MSSPQAIVIFDIDGVVRNVAGSYRRALADTVEQFTNGAYRPTPEAIDDLKGEGIWNNDWEASQELIYRYFESQGQSRNHLAIDYSELVAFFQSRYRGDPEQWNGYIAQEPLLMSKTYLETLNANQIGWGFFSGATRDSAEYVLQKRLGLLSPVLTAMEDAPGKPNPTGLLATVEQVYPDPGVPVFYAGDTVADMQTVAKAKCEQPERQWLAVGILPPHVATSDQRAQQYSQQLTEAGAMMVLTNVEALSAKVIQTLIT